VWGALGARGGGVWDAVIGRVLAFGLRAEVDLVTRLARQEELIQQLLNQQAATDQLSSPPHPVIQQMLNQQEAASSRPPSMAGLNAELAASNNGIPGSDATTNPEERERERCLLLDAKGFGLEFRPRLVRDDSA
jgi:hypothetical protein